MSYGRNLGVGPQGGAGTDGTDVVLDLALGPGLPGAPGLAGTDGTDSAPGLNGLNQTQPPNTPNGANGTNGQNSANSANGAQGPRVKAAPYIILTQSAAVTPSFVSGNGVTGTVGASTITFTVPSAGLYRFTVRLQGSSATNITVTNSVAGTVYLGLGVQSSSALLLAAGSTNTINITSPNPATCYAEVLKVN